MSLGRIRLIAAAAAIALATACAGGGTPALPGQTATQSASGSSNGTNVATLAPPAGLQTAQAPASTIKRVDAEKGRDDLDLDVWDFEEPLQVDSSGALTSLPYISFCSPLDVLFGVWYLALNDTSLPMGATTIPACSMLTKGSTANFYVVQVDVSLEDGVVITPLAGPVQSDGKEWTFSQLVKADTLQADHLYSFWVANYTGTGTP
jgi:hypothetical protein